MSELLDALLGGKSEEKSSSASVTIQPQLEPGPEPQPTPAQCPPLPHGVRLLAYSPRPAPVGIERISVVIDVNRFIKAELQELDARLNHPMQIKAGGSVFEILGRLQAVGLELAIDFQPGAKKEMEETL